MNKVDTADERRLARTAIETAFERTTRFDHGIVASLERETFKIISA